MRACFIEFQNFWRFQVYHLSWIIVKITPNRASCKGSGYNNVRKASSFHFYIVMVLVFWPCSLAKKSWQRKDAGFEKVFPEHSNEREACWKESENIHKLFTVFQSHEQCEEMLMYRSSGPVTEGHRVPSASAVSCHLCSVSQTLVEILPS